MLDCVTYVLAPLNRRPHGAASPPTPRRQRETGAALRSVHRGVQRAYQFRPLRSLRLKGSPAHVSALSSLLARPASGPVIREPPGRSSRSCCPAFLLPFGHPASAFLGTLSCKGVQPPLRSAYGTACAYPRLRCRPIAGFPRSARVRPGPGRAPFTPGTTVSAGGGKPLNLIPCRWRMTGSIRTDRQMNNCAAVNIFADKRRYWRDTAMTRPAR
jgi:hypothetical protein